MTTDYLIPPPMPASFGTEFKLPTYSQPLPLERLNPHENDADITFKEEEHVYFYKGQKLEKSVTEIVASYFTKFDRDSALRMMKNGKNWPRAEYMTKSGIVWTDAQILASWDKIGLYARHQGTWMHSQIERFLNALNITEGVEGTTPEINQFFEFYDKVIIAREILPFRTEWRICAHKHGFAGSVDFVGKLKNGEYVIIDWKRSQKLSTSLNNSYGKRGLHPLEHIEDTEASKYFLQLNIYRYVLQEYYGIKISSMILASFHPKLPTFFCLDVPVWDNEVSLVLKDLEMNKSE